MEKYGYKCFNKDMTNRYGVPLEVGKTYSIEGDIKFGNDGNGYHFCKNLEDTLRYFDAVNDEVSICYVKGFGNIDEYEDDYYGYYDMYASSNMEIIKKLSREEIINYALNLYPFRACRFIQLFKLTTDEIVLFKNKFKNDKDVINSLLYYQLGDKEVYKRRL